MKPPLEGIKVLDFGMAAVGPVSVTYLGFLGADVIKIESPAGDIVRRPWVITMGGMGTTFIGNNTNKRAIVLDLKTDKDRAIALKLVESADVVMDNFRSAGVMESLGMGYDIMSKANPRIIYLQSSAYGTRGPNEGMVSHDGIVQAAGGYAALNGPVGGEPEFSRSSARLDWSAAMINCAGLLGALYLRQRTGRGMRMDTNQFSSTIILGLTRYAEYFETGIAPGRLGSRRPNIVPDETFNTAMNYISVSVVNDAIWLRFCKALGLSNVVADARFSTNAKRVQNREALIPILQEVFDLKAAWQWAKVLKEQGVPCSEYFQDKPTSHQLMEHPQVIAHDMARNIQTPWGRANVSFNHWTFSKSTTVLKRSSPKLDEHRAEILAEIGITENADAVPAGKAQR